MYSNELMSYLYSYNLPQKSADNDDLEEKKTQAKSDDILNTFKKFSKICVTVPVEFRHE